MKYRRYKKREKGLYWMPFNSFLEHIDSVVICKYKDDYHTIHKSLDSKGGNPLACEIVVN